MATETIEKLLVTLEASTKQYETGLARAQGSTVTAMRRVETTLQASAARQQAIFAKMGAGLKTALFAGIAPVLSAFTIAGFRALTSELSALGKAAKRTGVDIESLQALTRSAELSGSTGGALVTAFERMSKFIGEAVTKGNDLSKILKANNIDIAEFGKLVPKEQFLILADLVARTANESERAVLMQAAFGRGAADLVPLLLQGADAIREQEQAARDTGKIIREDIVKAAEDFDDAWSDAWTSFRATAVNNIFPVFIELNKLREPILTYLRFLNAIRTGRVNSAIEAFGDFDRAIDALLGQFGEPVEVTVGVKADRLDLRPTVIPPLSGGANEFERANEAIARRIQLLELEADVFGRSTFEAEKARIAFELLEAAKQANIPITAELRAQIDALATAYGDAAGKITALEEAQKAAAASAEELARAQESAIQRMEELRDAGTDSMKGFVKDLIDGKSAADALNSAMQRLSDRLIDMGLDSIFTPVFGLAGTIIIEGTQT